MLGETSRKDDIISHMGEGSILVKTASGKADPGEPLHLYQRLNALRIPRERWEAGVDPVKLNRYGLKPP